MTGLETLRHSCAHIFAEAVLRIWPEAQFAAGPPVEQGFYYDVDLPHRISPEDFPKIEAEMAKVVAENQKFERSVVTRDEAVELGRAGKLAALGERGVPSRFKLDILEGIPEGEEISLYRNGAFTDLCAGPHVESTGKIGAFALTAVASAYYKGDENNPQLQRIYGVAFSTKEELEGWRVMQEEARKRDHRKLGRELQLFHVDEAVGPGLILWTPKGAIVRQELQNFISEELRRQGYEQVFTPHIGRLELYRKSGHYPYYADSQYPPLVERETLHRLAEEGCTCAELAVRLEKGEAEGYLLKPMNCPMHIKIFASQPRSYRDLPVRFAEFGTVYRWEQSGELNGMTRVRGFTQDDAHLFVTEGQMAAEIQGCLDLVKKVFGAFNMTDYRVRLGLREPGSDKYVGRAEDWDRAEAACRDAAKTLGVAYTEEQGEAAFYGPKIDFVVRDVIGREWQLGTVQVDFQLPERFDLHYTGADNKPHRPVMIHRAPFGSMERFVGVLIEHFAGAFPLWLAPEQVRILPVSDKFAAYADEVAGILRAAGVRAAVDTSQDKLGAKIRLAQVGKVPYMVVIGGKEVESRQVSVRSRKAGDEGAEPVENFVERIKQEISERLL
ncbi:MAG: threonine--tRNA ligase [Chthoniobacterales bacterium]|jgi:threonyl-tRNA synthetase|nr:threonine--tRNA ligase [Chthoniobacterales bacterium]